MTALSWALTILAVVVAAGLAVAVRHYRGRAREFEKLLLSAEDKLEQLQRQFERFVPPDVVERLTDSSDDVVPQKRQVTMLFADLRGFTAMCDALDPAFTVSILNDYFAHMTVAIARHHGHVTEIVGDGLLALFGALEANPWQARDAVLAALEMRAELERYNMRLREKGFSDLRFGVGIHCGEVVAGVIGTAGLSKFSVTGDPINVASRVEGLTGKYQVDILITEDIRRAIDESFQVRAMPDSIVKGKSEPVRTYHVVGVALRGQITAGSASPVETRPEAMAGAGGAGDRIEDRAPRA